MSSPDQTSTSDDLELHRGLDRELDLSAERPSAFTSDAPRGPGLMVAAIVASSLSLAGVITLVRGDEASTVDPQPSVPTVAPASVIAGEGARGPVAPVERPPKDAEPEHGAVVSLAPAPRPVVTPPSSALPDRTAPAAIVGAPASADRPASASAFDSSTALPSNDEPLRLPAPVFDDREAIEPVESTEAAGSAPVAIGSLPGVEPLSPSPPRDPAQVAADVLDLASPADPSGPGTSDERGPAEPVDAPTPTTGSIEVGEPGAPELAPAEPESEAPEPRGPPGGPPFA